MNITYAHEHVKLNLATPDKPNRILNDFEATVREFKKLKSLGVERMVDLTNMGMGRDVAFINKVALETGIKIAVATGYYKEPYFPAEVYNNDEHFLAKKMIAEITVGIEDTGIKAGVIGEIGSSLNVITPAEEKVFIAAAMVQVETGMPLITHTTLATKPLEQIALLKKYNVNLSQVVISHMDLSKSLSDIVKVLDTGVNIGFDTIGKLNYQPDETRAEYLKALCDKGYTSQIVMSVDITNNNALEKNGGIGYAYLIEKFLPLLDIKEADLNKILCENPDRIFARSFKNE
ncbi:MAG: phosphotriesterase-related protein [Alphaproteobacteria bacterium]|jgi:phosphotriesterase-related protein|nr:phosphotriesterase-related protein [Alphaproteobacteria bacterium]